MKKINKSIIGHTVQGRNIELYELGLGTMNLHIYGGIHGDEPESVGLLDRFITHLERSDCTLWHGKRLLIVPNLNPDGFAQKTRVNAHHVDLNRNFPSRSWSAHYAEKKNFPGVQPKSEPEVDAIVNLIKKYPPLAILSVHSWISQINFDGPARHIALNMSQTNQYPVTEHIGYETAGSLGQWMGRDHHIPTITLEVPEKTSFDIVWKENREALVQFIKLVK